MIVCALFSKESTEFRPNFFSTLSKLLWSFPEEKCEVYIHLIFKEFPLFFQLFRCLIQVFFQNPAKVFSGAFPKLRFVSTEKFSAKSFLWKKLLHFICSLIFERRKIGVMATTFEQELKNAVFLPRWSFKVYFFNFDKLERRSTFFPIH